MVRARLLVLLGLAVSLAAGSLLPAFAQDALEPLELSIRDTRLEPDGQTELVVNVTGEARPDVLPADAFTVTEQGESVEGLEVEPLLGSGVEDVYVTLAIDVSESMQGEAIEVTREAAAGLLTDLTESGVLVQLITFASDVEVLTDFTSDTQQLVDAVEGIEAVGATRLYQSLVVAAEELAAVSGQPNLVLFSDGGDNGSPASLEEGIAAIQEVEAPITTVAIETIDLDPAALGAMSGETGGRSLSTAELDEIETLFEEVASDLASQYVLRYASTRSDPDTLELGVTVAAAGEEAATTFVVPNTRNSGLDAPPPAIVDRDGGLLSNPIVLYVGIGVAFASILIILLYLLAGVRSSADKNLQSQLSRYIEGGDERAGRSSAVSAYFRDRAVEFLETAPRPKGFDAGLERRLEQAAWPLRSGEFMAFVVLSGLAVGLLVGALVNILGGVLLGIIAAIVPFIILEQRRSKRRSRFLRQLPDTLQLMAGSLRAGYGTLQAIDSVAKESASPTSEEFGRVLTEARLGMPIEEALGNMAERIDNADFRWVVMAINIQREVGGNLAELLDTVAEVLREREMLRRQIDVLSAEGRLSAYILIGLPIFLTIYLILVRPDYISTLITSGAIGYLLIGGAVVLMIAGVIWIRNLIRIEV